ncbi:hypothetical protein BKA57DRAFT_513829 [Linnemannia elongata]|nr:hypothetical protein BKA57DRAFT_513829 [Linnemannia elongata]
MPTADGEYKNVKARDKAYRFNRIISTMGKQKLDLYHCSYGKCRATFLRLHAASAHITKCRYKGATKLCPMQGCQRWFAPNYEKKHMETYHRDNITPPTTKAGVAIPCRLCQSLSQGHSDANRAQAAFITSIKPIRMTNMAAHLATHDPPYTDFGYCSAKGCLFYYWTRDDAEEHFSSHPTHDSKQRPYKWLLSFSNFHDFVLTVTDQAYLLGAGLDDSNGEFDETVEYDEEDKTETGDQAGRDLYQGSSLSLGPVEGERAGGVSSPENETGNVVDFQGRQCIDAIPSGTFQVATITILVHSSHESTLESAIVVFETDNYTPRFVVDKGVPKKV